MAREQTEKQVGVTVWGALTEYIKNREVFPGDEGKLLEGFKQGGGRIIRCFRYSSPVDVRKMDLTGKIKGRKTNVEAAGLGHTSH